MSDRTIRDEARLYFVPYILGNNPTAHKLAARIFRKFGIVSLICDDHRSARDLIDMSSKTLMLTPTDSPRLLAEQLISLAAQNKYTLPIIISTDERFQSMLDRERELLEHTFVFADADSLFDSSPLVNIF
ncbi:MAG: hypothetical protein J6L85_00245 [Clostridia bacterium]|nr:hypothetical protein [Clostridia bacterium]